MMTTIKKYIHSHISLCFLLVLVFNFMNPSLAYANSTNDNSIGGTYQRIFDEAGLLSTGERENLEAMSQSYSQDAAIDIFILTHNNSRAKDGDIYIEDFADRMKVTDAAILLVDMKNRDIVIHGYGLAEIYIHSKRIDPMIDEISPYLSNEQYTKAFETFIKKSAAFMSDSSELNYDTNYNLPNNTAGGSRNTYNNSTSNVLLSNRLYQIFFSLIVGLIVVGIMAYNSGGKNTTNSSTYMDPSKSGLIGRRDQYLRTSVTRVRKPQNNTSSTGGLNAGGFRGGVSSGGRSHSSGRGKF